MDFVQISWQKILLKGSSIDGVKIDCITHSYDYLENPYIESV